MEMVGISYNGRSLKPVYMDMKPVISFEVEKLYWVGFFSFPIQTRVR